MNRKYKTILIYLVILFIIIFSSIFPETISGHSPFAISYSGISSPGANHIFGTDFLGRDIFSRTLIGGRISIVVGVVARFGTVFLGLLIGLAAGLSGIILKKLLNSITEIFLAIPSLLLAMGLAVSIGEGYNTIIIAIVVGTWAPVARFVSVQVIEISNYSYINSAKVIGASRLRIIVKYIMPALFPLLVPILTTGIATSIMLESTLSFLGLAGTGLESIPSWGIMIQEGSKFIFDAPWIIIPPSIILTILILCFNAIGDRLANNRFNLQ